MPQGRPERTGGQMKPSTCGKCKGTGETPEGWVCFHGCQSYTTSTVKFDKRKWERRRKRIEIRPTRGVMRSEYKWVAIMAVDSLDKRTKVYPIATPNGLFVGRGDTVAEAVAKLRMEWRRDLRRHLEEQQGK